MAVFDREVKYVPGVPGFWDPENYMPQLNVQSRAGPIVPFNLFPAQQILAAAVRQAYQEQRWVVHVKPRREGSSTFFTGLGYQHASSRVGCRVAILANKTTTALELSQMAIRFHKYAPRPLKPRRSRGLKRTLEFPELDSVMTVHSVRDEEPLRGSAAYVVIATEISSWMESYVEDAWVAARSAVPDDGGLLISESTPRYHGDPQHAVWMEGDAPGSRWIKVFIPWTVLPEYALRPPPRWVPSSVVREYADKYHITEAQAYWMESRGLPKCKNELGRFKAEYPINEFECWTMAGDEVFSSDVLTAWLMDLTEGVVLGNEESSEYTEWRTPESTNELVIITCDPASSWAKRDFFGIEVFSVSRCEQLAECRFHADAYHVARKLIELSQRFNDAMVYVEANGVGDAVLSHLLALGFRKVYFRPASAATRRARGGAKVPGWYSNVKTKAEAIGFLQELIRDESITIRSVRLLRQLLSYRGAWDRLDRDAGGGHHDLVAALALAAWVYFQERGNLYRERTLSADEKAKRAWREAVARIEKMEQAASRGRGLDTPFGTHR